MAEIQQSTNSADLTQRFIYFVQMQMQNVLLCLGLIEHPSAPKGEADLHAAKMFIDQLEMIREKTRGNLTKDEEKFLTGVLSELQMAFVQVSAQQQHGGSAPAEEPVTPAAEAPQEKGEEPAPVSSPDADEEGKKKFTKSYGA